MSRSGLSRLRDVKIPVRAVYGECSLTLRDVLMLGHQGLVGLDRPAGSLVDLFVADRLIARGEVVAVGNRIAVRVVQVAGGEDEADGRG